MAFFPCIRFENQILLSFRGQAAGIKNRSDEEKILLDMQLIEELKEYYLLFNKLYLICKRRALKIIIENPYSQEHFLRRYWCIPPTIIDEDRRINGDYFKKPTQYWFLNIEPKQNLLFEPIQYINIDSRDAIRYMKKSDWEKTGAKSIKEARSMIHPQYANRFIRQYILDN